MSEHDTATTRPGNGSECPRPGNGSWHIRPGELATTTSTLALYERFAEIGHADNGERGLLEFLSLAEHARNVNPTRPEGVFVSLLRDRRFDMITNDEERTAHDAFKSFVANEQMSHAVQHDFEGIGSLVFRQMRKAKGGEAHATTTQTQATMDRSVANGKRASTG
jgi:hypothetical protein